MPFTAEELAIAFPLKYAIQELQNHLDDCPLCVAYLEERCEERDDLLDAVQAARPKRPDHLHGVHRRFSLT